MNTASKVLLDFFQKIAGSRGGAPDALRTASRSEAFRAQPAEGGLLARDERGTLSPVKRIFRVNCRRRAARGCFLQEKKHPFPTPVHCQSQWDGWESPSGIRVFRFPFAALSWPCVRKKAPRRSESEKSASRRSAPSRLIP